MRTKTGKNAAFPWLHPDAPQVPEGLEPITGVYYGCGQPDCANCYKLKDYAQLADPLAVGQQSTQQAQKGVKC